jgi:hypothetical protein
LEELGNHHRSLLERGPSMGPTSAAYPTTCKAICFKKLRIGNITGQEDVLLYSEPMIMICSGLLKLIAIGKKSSLGVENC